MPRMSASVEAVQAAFVSGDRETLRRLLHPYLHWTDAAGVTVRGRKNVLAILDGLADLPAPRSIELRDGQVYRWSA
jgi:hypothetical protein